MNFLLWLVIYGGFILIFYRPTKRLADSIVAAIFNKSDKNKKG